MHRSCSVSQQFLFVLPFISHLCVAVKQNERTFGAADLLQLSKYAYTFYVCATFVLTFHVQSRPLYPCLHTRAHKGRVHVIHIWVAARFIFIHYCNILEAVQAILFILTTVTTFPIYLYSTHFVTHYQSIYTNLSSAINIIDILLGIYSSSLEYRVWQKRSERLCPSCQEKLLTAFPRRTCHIENVMG